MEFLYPQMRSESRGSKMLPGSMKFSIARESMFSEAVNEALLKTEQDGNGNEGLRRVEETLKQLLQEMEK